VDQTLGIMIGGAFTLTALFFALVALVVRVGYRRTPWLSGGLAIVSVLVVIGTTMAMAPGYDEGERERVERLHARFAPTLERYRQAHGEYPPTLEAAGIPTPTTLYGPLRYDVRREKDGMSVYTIGFGDYGVNGFTTWWDSRTSGWSLDS
jgi:hypothetical protein